MLRKVHSKLIKILHLVVIQENKITVETLEHWNEREISEQKSEENIISGTELKSLKECGTKYTFSNHRKKSKTRVYSG